MARSKAIKARELRWEASNWRTKRQWQHWERVGLRPSMTMDDLRLYFYDDNQKLHRVDDLEILGAISEMTLDRTIEGASTIEITMKDPNQKLFSTQANRMRVSRRKRFAKTPQAVDDAWQPINLPNLIGRAAEINLDGVIFRLTKVTYTHSTQELHLTFEDRIVYWLRRKRGQKHLSRAKGTRAEFILALLREIKREKIPFICPELHTKQKIYPVKTD